MHQAQRLSIHTVIRTPSVHLAGLLASLEHQDWQEFQTVVVDDASGEGLAAGLAAHPEVIVLRNFKPRGFSEAHNQAIALALSRWPEPAWAERVIAILHPEVVLAPKGLARLARALASHPDWAAAGPKILQASSSRPAEDGELDEPILSDEVESQGCVITKSRDLVPRASGDPVFSLSSACILFRASALSAASIGGEWLDARLHEEAAVTDLLWRCRLLGWQVGYVSEAAAWRMRAPAAGSDPAHPAYRQAGRQASLFEIEWPLVRFKNDTWVNRLLHLPWIAWSGAQRSVRALTRPSSWWARLATLRHVPSAWKKRRELLSRVKVTSRQMRAWFV